MINEIKIKIGIIIFFILISSFVLAVDDTTTTTLETTTTTLDNIAPTVKISLSDESPVKAGIIEVKLETSEDVQFTPSLSYELTGEASVAVPLSGSGKNWKGYMIITEDNKEKIGTFSFSAYDIIGNKGEAITDGKLFIVDTIKPLKISNIQSTTIDDEYVEISWYDDEYAVYYNIYRDENSGVDKNDFYIRIDEAEFVDNDIINDVTYYYKISAVDEAGNEGELSDEMTAVLSNSRGSIITSKNNLDSEYIAKIEDKIKEINDEINKINGLSFDESLEEILDIKNKISDGKNKLNSLKTELEGLKTSEQETVDDELRKIDFRINAIKAGIPEKIEIIDEINHKQGIISFEDVQEASLYLSILEDQLSYIKKNANLQDSININVDVKNIEIRYLDSSVKEYTIVDKNIVAENELDDVYVIESIPKNVAEEVSKISLNGNYDVLKEDPVIRWTFSKLKDDRISYVIQGKINLDDAKESKTIVMLKSTKENGLLDNITGNAVYNSNSVLKIISSIVIIFFVGLFSYYFFSINNKKINFKNDNNDIHYNIRLLDKHIEQGNFEHASRIYSDIVKGYRKISFDNHRDRKIFYDNLMEKYEKLVLMQKIQNIHLYAYDRDKLKSLLNEVIYLANNIDENSSLMEQSRKVIEFYSEFLSK